MLPINYCFTLCNIANKIGVCPETVCALVNIKKSGKRRNLKLCLTNWHKENWLQWIHNLINKDNLYVTFYQYVHIDKKCFVFVKIGNRYYLDPDKAMPPCWVQHKCHVTKVMFLLATAYPRIVPSTGGLRDRMLSIWAFSKAVEAKQLLKNCLKGNNRVETNKGDKRDSERAVDQTCSTVNWQEMAEGFLLLDCSCPTRQCISAHIQQQWSLQVILLT